MTQEASRGNKLVTHDSLRPRNVKQTDGDRRAAAGSLCARPIISPAFTTSWDVEDSAATHRTLPDSTFRAQTPAIAHSRLRSHCIARAAPSLAPSRARVVDAHPRTRPTTRVGANSHRPCSLDDDAQA